MLKVLDRRFKDVHVIVNPVRVQGEGAKEDIAEAIRDFNDYSQAQGRDEKIDVLIVGRGGGSIEDLWAFNEEVVARAIHESRIPVISAVGHERDWTIADMVADVRAATPSVAAELVLPEKEELRAKVAQAAQVLQASLAEMVFERHSSLQEKVRRLRLATGHAWEIAGNELDALRNKLRVLNPATLIPEYKRKISDAARQICVRMQHLLELKRSDLTTEIEKLSGLNPLNILARGYSVTFSMADGRLVKDASKVSAGDSLRTRLHRGEIISTVREVHTDGRDQV
jgi:exodeoxyribonuclease VII large subunit